MARNPTPEKPEGFDAVPVTKPESLQAGRNQLALILSSGVMVVLAALGFGRFSMALILPSMRSGLGLNYAQIGFIVTAAFLGYLSFSLGSGIAAAKWGPRKVIALSLLLTGITMIGTGMSHGFWMPFILLTLAGIGMAGANVPVMGMVSAWVSPRRRGLASGLLVSGSGFGLLINGFLLPGWLAAPGGQGWRTSWIRLGLAVVLVGLWAAAVLRDRPGVQLKKAAVPQGSIWSRIASILREKPILRQLALVYFAFGFSYVIFTTYFGDYLIKTRGWSPGAAGALWSWVGVISLPSGFIWGWVSDRIGRKWGLFAVYFLHGICLVSFAALPYQNGITLAALLYGLSIWSVPAIMSAACGDEVGPELASTALGAITVAFGLGQMTAPAVAGIMLDRGWGMMQNLWLSALVAFLGAVGSALLHVPVLPWLTRILGRGANSTPVVQPGGGSQTVEDITPLDAAQK